MFNKKVKWSCSTLFQGAQEIKNCGDEIILASTGSPTEHYKYLKARLHTNSEILKSDLGAIIKKTKYSMFQGDYFASSIELTLATNPTLNRFSSLSLELVSWEKISYGNHKTNAQNNFLFAKK